jgi:hypothetical protein
MAKYRKERLKRHHVVLAVKPFTIFYRHSAKDREGEGLPCLEEKSIDSVVESVVGACEAGSNAGIGEKERKDSEDMRLEEDYDLSLETFLCN